MKLNNLKIAIVIILVFLIFISVNRFFYQEVKKLSFIVSPIEKLFWQKENNFFQWLESIFKIKQIKLENQKLKKENFSLMNQILELRDIEKENETLKKALGLGLNQEYNLILADLISKKTEDDSILINKGRKQGVKKDNTVITEEKVLIGKIGKVFDDFSQVLLISQKDFNFSVKIMHNITTTTITTTTIATTTTTTTTSINATAIISEEITGMAQGKENFKIDIKFLPKQAEIKKGDLIATSILGGIFPKDLLVGEIKDIKKNDIEPFQQGEIKPYFKEIELEKVFIISD